MQIPRTVRAVAMLVALVSAVARSARPLLGGGEFASENPPLGEFNCYEPATKLLVAWQRV